MVISISSLLNSWCLALILIIVVFFLQRSCFFFLLLLNISSTNTCWFGLLQVLFSMPSFCYTVTKGLIILLCFFIFSNWILINSDIFIELRNYSLRTINLSKIYSFNLNIFTQAIYFIVFKYKVKLKYFIEYFKVGISLRGLEDGILAV